MLLLWVFFINNFYKIAINFRLIMKKVIIKGKYIHLVDIKIDKILYFLCLMAHQPYWVI